MRVKGKLIKRMTGEFPNIFWEVNENELLEAEIELPPEELAKQLTAEELEQICVIKDKEKYPEDYPEQPKEEIKV